MLYFTGSIGINKLIKFATSFTKDKIRGLNEFSVIIVRNSGETIRFTIIQNV